jgi:DNA-binding NarL/FixJ family response regulator
MLRRGHALVRTGASSYRLDGVTRLRATDMEAALAFVAEAHATDGPELFTTELLGRLAALVPCEGVFVNERDFVRRELVADVFWCAEHEIDCDVPWEDDWTLIARHPLNLYRRRTRDLGVVHLSDLYGRCARVRGQIFPEYCATFGIVDISGIVLSRSETYTVKLGLESKERDFNERDRSMLELLRPHLCCAERQARMRRLVTAALAALEKGDDRTPAVVLLGHGDIEFASPRARQLLEAYFGRVEPVLPEELQIWLRDATARYKPYGKARAGRRLEVNVDPRNRSVLLLDEKPNVVPLTPREWDVIRCVGAGMSNIEIGRFLCVTPGTVRKHLENIYAKLGVGSRTAALAKLGPRLVDELRGTGVG